MTVVLKAAVVSGLLQSQRQIIDLAFADQEPADAQRKHADDAEERLSAESVRIAAAETDAEGSDGDTRHLNPETTTILRSTDGNTQVRAQKPDVCMVAESGSMALFCQQQKSALPRAAQQSACWMHR